MWFALLGQRRSEPNRPMNMPVSTDRSAPLNVQLDRAEHYEYMHTRFSQNGV
jgi:hypothetical protein